ncbi:MAG: Lrp/AsnC family transcriptional regulator [Candidatus Heimdallarchaeaceae archaeon]|jgi:DNA-binding Lrp family transcriptional regulator
MSVDKLDKEIINILRKDSKTPFEKIAKLLNTTRQTIHNRVRSLRENGVIRSFSIIVDDKAIGLDVTAIILILLDRAASVWEFTAKELWTKKEDLGIIEMHHLAGEYDVMVKLKTENIGTLEKNLVVITSIKGVQRTHTLICLSGYEYGHQLYDVLSVEKI